MSDFKDVPTEQLLSFQEFTPIHEASFSSAQLKVDLSKEHRGFDDYSQNTDDVSKPLEEIDKDKGSVPSFWSGEFYQQLFDVDTSDVVERIIASFIPRRDTLFKTKIKLKPDLYGPLWISITLVFAIAISGNIAKYIGSRDVNHQWRYNFHIVSYAATAIYIYIGFIPVLLWALLKWSTDTSEADDMELEEASPPNILELICIYGYSIFIYVPISILWTIQFELLQWFLVVVGALLSGSVLLYTLMPALRRSKHKLLLVIGVSVCHLLLAAGFKWYFFHTP